MIIIYDIHPPDINLLFDDEEKSIIDRLRLVVLVLLQAIHIFLDVSFSLHSCARSGFNIFLDLFIP